MTGKSSKKQWVDLHIHTQASDGTYSPKEIIDAAKANDLDFISITDHDTVDGCIEALNLINTNNSNSLRLISGIEISVEYKNGTLHILGYGFDISNSVLTTRLQELQKIRKQRNQAILERLQNIEIDISIEDLELLTENNKSPGRPHIARILVEKGIVRSIDEAFNEYLSKGRKAYIPKRLLTPNEAIELIHNSGGIAFIAHPITLNLETSEFRQFIDQMKADGIDGIEAFSPIHQQKDIEFFKLLAQKNQLLISGGSDFHGEVKPEINLGNCHLGRRLDISSISPELIEQFHSN